MPSTALSELPDHITSVPEFQCLVEFMETCEIYAEATEDATLMRLLEDCRWDLAKLLLERGQ